ncbi:MAG: tol-pal system-associated acyl-CoA thioesterase [Gammaproteobacteria bacterium]|nr:tol-pal system-associated acyl-CoA thioesterase [Gammaproteobacteria bacterium]
MKEFMWPVRVYYEDTDNGGVVYYANYLKFMERARTEWLRAMGVEQDYLVEKHDLIFAVRSAQVEYRKPARFNQLLNVTAGIAKTGKASITFEQKITPAEDNTVLLCDAQIRVVSLSASTFTPKPLPKGISMEIFGGN